MSSKKRLGELLIEAGVIDDAMLQSALGHQRRWGGRIGQALLDLKMCSEPVIVEALARKGGFEVARLGELDSYALEQALKLVPLEFAQRNNVFPLGADTATITVAMPDPTNLALADELRFRTGRRVKVCIGGDRAITEAIRRYYQVDQSSASAPIALDFETTGGDGVPLAEPFEGGSTEDMRAMLMTSQPVPAAPPPAVRVAPPPAPAPRPAAPPAPAAPAAPAPRAAPTSAGLPAAGLPAAAPARAAPTSTGLPSAQPGAPRPAPPAAPAPPPTAPRAPAPGAPRPTAAAMPAARPGATSPGLAPAVPVAPRPAPPVAAPGPAPAASAAVVPPASAAPARSSPATVAAPAHLAPELEELSPASLDEGEAVLATDLAPEDDMVEGRVAVRELSATDLALLDALDRIAAGIEDPSSTLKPARLLSALLRLLLRRKLVTEQELLDELSIRR